MCVIVSICLIEEMIEWPTKTKNKIVSYFITKVGFWGPQTLRSNVIIGYVYWRPT